MAAHSPTTASRRPRTRTRRVSAAPDDARQRILDAALRLFALHGLDGMSLQMLADDVGLHKSSLFHHFRGKDELCLACLNRVLDGLLHVVQPLSADDATDIETVVQISEALADHFSAHPTEALFLTRSLIGGRDEIDTPGQGGATRVPEFFTIVGGWLERARRAETIRPIRVRHALINLMGLVLFYPSIAGGFGRGLLGFDPTSPRAAKTRRDELGKLVRAALAPER